MQETSRNMMLREFEDRLDRLGADFSRWPQECADMAQALLETNPEARCIHREAEEISGLFAADLSVKAPAGLAGRIVAMAGEISGGEQKTSDINSPEEGNSSRSGFGAEDLQKVRA